jgi:hypothetical protein
MQVAGEPAEMELPLSWVISEDQPPIPYASEFALIGTATEFCLTVGQVVPPVVTGRTNEEKREQLEKQGFVAIRPLGRYMMTPEVARKLAKVLAEALKTYGDANGGDRA